MKLVKENLENKLCTYGIIVFNKNDINKSDWFNYIKHFCGYWDKPTKDDISSLKEELKTDEEFGLTNEFNDLVFYEATKEILDYYNSLNIM
jgi:hypothetical protein